MAARTEVVLIDYIDGSVATETLQFSLDGRVFEIDLNSENAAALRSSLETYVNAARRVSGRTRRLK